MNSETRARIKGVKLDFMVVPELLSKLAYVPNKVRCKVIDPDAIFLTGILGDSGKKLVKAGIEFYFTQELARKLIDKEIAQEVQVAQIATEIRAGDLSLGERARCGVIADEVWKYRAHIPFDVWGALEKDVNNLRNIADPKKGETDD